MKEAVDVDFAAQAVEANGLVARGFYVHSPTVDASPYTCDEGNGKGYADNK
nr:hypothetical protein [Pseudomonas vranovensis]